MKTHLQCYSCLMRQSVEAVERLNLHEDIQNRIMRIVARDMSEIDPSKSPLLMMGNIHRTIRAITGEDDPYEMAKKNCNRNVMELHDELKRLIHRSSDSLLVSICLAIAGNTIDFVVDRNADQANIHSAIEESLAARIEGETFARFQNDLANARKILYIGDNAGEVVFDRLLLELLPTEKMTFVVRGRPVINDVTMIEAQEAGITDLVRVIDNGSDLPGTLLPTCSDSFQREFHEADLIIAKGQGNFESLYEVRKNIYFLFKVKCPVAERIVHQPIGRYVLINSIELGE